MGSALSKARSAAIREEQIRQHLFEILRLLHVQGTKLQIQDQHLRIRFGSHDMVRGLESIDGRVATHKADHGSFD